MKTVADTAQRTWDNHPAKFSDAILDRIRPFVHVNARVLDPFAGTGRVHELGTNTWGVEIEPEGANMHPRTIVGNALHLPFADDSFDYVVTSPCYGNRMADSHNAQERCRACDETGINPENLTDCQKCGGTGRRQYKRITYTHSLGRKLHPDNAGAMQWGPKYRTTHTAAWKEVYRVLKPHGMFLLNVSNHIRNGEEVDVVDWHWETCEAIGFLHRLTEEVETPRMLFGQNRDLRVETESILGFTKAA